MNVATAVAMPRPSRARAAVLARSPTTWILVAVTVAAAVLRFWDLGHQSLWYDEGLTAMEVHLSFGRMLGLLPRIESNPPIFYSLEWGWARIFGFGAAALRSLSAVAGVAAVPVLYGIGARLVSRRAGLIAATLAACNPFLIWYSQEARSYSLVFLFAALAWLAFAHILVSGPSAESLAGWAIAAALTLATHYYGVLAIVPQAVWMLVAHRRRTGVWLAVAAVAAVGGGLLPLALSQESLGNWIATHPLDQRLSQMAPQALLGTGAPARTWLKLAGAIALAVVAAMMAFRAEAQERRGARVFGALAVTGFLLGLGLALAGIDNLITRNLIVLMIPLIGVVAAGLGARRAGSLGLASMATLCVIGLIAAIGVAVNWPLQRADWRGLVAALNSSQVPGGRAILVQDNAGIYPLADYLPGLRFMPRAGARVRELDVIAAGNGESGAWFCWWGAACNLVPSQLDSAIHVRGFEPVGPEARFEQFSFLRLRAPAAVPLTPRDIKQGVRHTRMPAYWLYVQPRT